jgi:hypothetical protein
MHAPSSRTHAAWIRVHSCSQRLPLLASLRREQASLALIRGSTHLNSILSVELNESARYAVTWAASVRVRPTEVRAPSVSISGRELRDLRAIVVLKFTLTKGLGDTGAYTFAKHSTRGRGPAQ